MCQTVPNVINESLVNSMRVGAEHQMHCGHCKAEYNSVNDILFIVFGNEVYCCLACLRAAAAKPNAMDFLVFESDSMNSLARRMARSDGELRVCGVCCDLEALGREVKEAEQPNKGDFWAGRHVYEAAEKRYDRIAEFLGVKVCSTLCAERYVLTTMPDFDCKGFWTSQERTRCTQCGVVNRNDCDESFVDLAVKNGTVTFCSSACILAFLDSERVSEILWQPFIEAGRHSKYVSEGCMGCGKNADLRWGEEDAEVHSIRESSAEMVGRSMYLGFDDPERKRLQNEAEQLEQKSFTLLAQRFPVYAAPFLAMDAGYGPPVDDGGVFCSIECVRTLFGDEGWRHWDAKGGIRPRPDGHGRSA